MDKIIIYTQEKCIYCGVVKDTFKTEKIKFEERLITEYKEEWMKVIALTQMPTTPTIYYKENYFVSGRDFPNPEVLVKILENFVDTKDLGLFKITENFKTLNYNMGAAFARLDQLLRQIETKLNKEE